MILLSETFSLEQLSYIATIVGAFSFFFAIIIFLLENRRRRHESELSTYDNLSKEYREFIKLCFENYELQVFAYDFHENLNVELDNHQKVRKYMIFEILVSLLESAYFQYKNHKNAFKKTQWTGWVQYTYDWCSRKDFQIAWKEHLSSEFDNDFLNFMNSLMNKRLEEEKLNQQKGE